LSAILCQSKRFEKGVVKVRFDSTEEFANSIATLLKDEELREKTR
jgi:hypothetical protein